MISTERPTDTAVKSPQPEVHSATSMPPRTLDPAIWTRLCLAGILLGAGLLRLAGINFGLRSNFATLATPMDKNRFSP